MRPPGSLLRLRRERQCNGNENPSAGFQSALAPEPMLHKSAKQKAVFKLLETRMAS